MKTDGTCKKKASKGEPWVRKMGGSTPPQSKVLLQPKHIGKSFWFRLREWLK